MKKTIIIGMLTIFLCVVSSSAINVFIDGAETGEFSESIWAADSVANYSDVQAHSGSKSIKIDEWLSGNFPENVSLFDPIPTTVSFSFYFYYNTTTNPSFSIEGFGRADSVSNGYLFIYYGQNASIIGDGWHKYERLDIGDGYHRYYLDDVLVATVIPDENFSMLGGIGSFFSDTNPEDLPEDLFFDDMSIDVDYCNEDTDCGFCEYCSVGTCIYQDSGNDVKNDCGACNYCDGTGGCTAEPDDGDLKDMCEPGYDCGGPNPGIYRHWPGECKTGYCRSSSWYPGDETPVTNGNICIDGSNWDVNPTIDNYCGIWSDCVSGETTAPEYLVGYLDDMSGHCSTNDWIEIGTNWTAPDNYMISVTEHAENCSIERTTISGGGGGTYVGAYEPIPETRAAEIAPATGLSDNQKGAVVIGLVALGVIGYNAGLFKGTTRTRRRRR